MQPPVQGLLNEKKRRWNLRSSTDPTRCGLPWTSGSQLQGLCPLKGMAGESLLMMQKSGFEEVLCVTLLKPHEVMGIHSGSWIAAHFPLGC